MIPSSVSSRRAKCSLETAVVTVELFEVEEKKPELLAAHADGYAGRAKSAIMRRDQKSGGDHFCWGTPSNYIKIDWN